jgi:beta-glucosidase
LNPNKEEDVIAAKKTDALINRLFIEPLLGYGYPKETLPFLNKLEPYIKSNDLENLIAIPDFIGIQNYTREVVSHSKLTPYLNAKIIDAKSRNVDRTIMNWEIYPESIFEMIKQFNQYKEINQLYITENGAAFNDRIIDGHINDEKRVNYIKAYIEQVLRAKNEGLKVDGYFVWSLLDNFEWSEGYTPRFGIVHVDFETQHRTVKKSGKWYSNFIKEHEQNSKSIMI